MRYDHLRRVLVVAGLLLPAAALFSQTNLSQVQRARWSSDRATIGVTRAGAAAVVPAPATAAAAQGTAPAGDFAAVKLPDGSPMQLSERSTADSKELTLEQRVPASHARMVRVSFVRGAVMIKRPGAAEAEKAMVNMPVREGCEISTSSDSSAEVQFENGSVVHFNPSSKLLFYELALDAEGNKLNGMTIEKGEAGFRFIPERQDIYQVKVADATLTPNGTTEIYAAFIPGRLRVRVVAGSIMVSAHAHSVTLGKGKMMEYDPLMVAGGGKTPVRVVRLSYVNGTVTVKRPGAAGAEKAILNMPIQEGYGLSTAANSYAEVEFENGSTARLGELSACLFHQLSVSPQGARLNGMTFERGYATFHLLPERASRTALKGDDGIIYFQPVGNDVYQVKIADVTATANDKCEFRTDLSPDALRVEVFSGAVEVADAVRSAKLGSGKVLEHKPGGTEMAFDIRKGIVKDAWDEWTEARDRQVELALNDQAVMPRGPRYGWSELDSYGEWVNLPGRGTVWSPYAQSGWSPYTNGQWLWSDWGWTWASAEPWGWLPYHCGQWGFDDGFGWYWMMPMAGCGYWQGAMVNWFQGPGWIGWAPQGIGAGFAPGGTAPGGTTQSGRPHPGPGPRPVHFPRGLVTVPTQIVQNGQLVTPAMVNHTMPTLGSRIAGPPFELIAPAAGAATLLTAHEGIASQGHTATPAVAPSSLSIRGRGPGFALRHASAPPTILMGGNAAVESSFLGGRHSHSGHVPLRSMQGATLGGRYIVHGSPGEFHGNAASGGGRFGGTHGMNGPAGGPMLPHSSGNAPGVAVMPHGSARGGSWGGGGARPMGGGGGGGFSGGGGNSGTNSGGGRTGGGGGFSGGGGNSVGGGGGHSMGGSPSVGGGGGGMGGSGGGAAPTSSGGGHH